MTVGMTLRERRPDRASPTIEEITIYQNGTSVGHCIGGDASSLPEPVIRTVCDDELIQAVDKALPLTRNSHKPTWQNRGIGIFIFRTNSGNYTFRHLGPYASEGFKGGQDFGAVGRHRVLGSSGLVISVPQWESIRNGALRSVESIRYYREISKDGEMPVFVRSTGDFNAMMLYHHSYEGAIQIRYRRGR